MPKTPSPSMPTKTQISDTQKNVCELYPNARIRRVGPDGIEFVYPDELRSTDQEIRPFNSRRGAKDG